MHFFELLKDRARSVNSLLCVGLDPEPPASCADPAASILETNRALIESCSEFALCFKPNIAFYEAFGPQGLRALEETIALIPEEVPVILDAKRCDIGNTAKAYAQACFGRFRADAVTLSPYMGRDSVEPFLAWKGKAAFLLARTSNEGASAFQDRRVLGRGPSRLFEAVGAECASWSKSIGLVVAGNDYEALAAMRDLLPSTWFLAPGIGAQGGDARKACEAGLDDEGFGIIPVVVRAIARSDDPGRAAKEYRDTINEARAAKTKARVPKGGPRAEGARVASLKARFMDALIDSGCFKTGSFVLKSGITSPFYIDLRRLISNPESLSVAAEAYESLLGDLEFERIAGIPLAALPLATAFALKAGFPLVYPRMQAKQHGTGNLVEGHFEPGDRVLVVDDLITTGLSKIEAADAIEGAGLKVAALAVLIERGSQGRKDMEARGIELRSFIQVEELFEHCLTRGIINAAQRDEMLAFARG